MKSDRCDLHTDCEPFRFCSRLCELLFAEFCFVQFLIFVHPMKFCFVVSNHTHANRIENPHTSLRETGQHSSSQTHLTLFRRMNHPVVGFSFRSCAPSPLAPRPRRRCKNLSSSTKKTFHRVTGGGGMLGGAPRGACGYPPLRIPTQPPPFRARCSSPVVRKINFRSRKYLILKASLEGTLAPALTKLGRGEPQGG